MSIRCQKSDFKPILPLIYTKFTPITPNLHLFYTKCMKGVNRRNPPTHKVPEWVHLPFVTAADKIRMGLRI